MTSPGEVWLVNFPLEEDPSQFLPRPVVVLNVLGPEILSTKVTKHDPRVADLYDTPIQNWKVANLNYPSTARVSKTIILSPTDFIHKIGVLDDNDLLRIQEVYTKFFYMNF